MDSSNSSEEYMSELPRLRKASCVVIDSDSDNLLDENSDNICEISSGDEFSDTDHPSDQKLPVIVIDDEDGNLDLKDSEQKSDESQIPVLEKKLVDYIDSDPSSPHDVCGNSNQASTEPEQEGELEHVGEPELEPESKGEPESEPKGELESDPKGEPESDPMGELEYESQGEAEPKAGKGEPEQEMTAEEAKKKRAAYLLAQQRKKRKNRYICMSSSKPRRKRRRSEPQGMPSLPSTSENPSPPAEPIPLGQPVHSPKGMALRKGRGKGAKAQK